MLQRGTCGDRENKHVAPETGASPERKIEDLADQEHVVSENDVVPENGARKCKY